VDVGDVRDFVSKVDAKIRRTRKDIEASRHMDLPLILVKDLVAYVISWINSERSAAINQNLAVDYKKEFSLAFGDYCEVYNGTNNTSWARSIPGIALHPCNNAAGSWALLN
jgi:hypothetical protein